MEAPCDRLRSPGKLEPEPQSPWLRWTSHTSGRCLDRAQGRLLPDRSATGCEHRRDDEHHLGAIVMRGRSGTLEARRAAAAKPHKPRRRTRGGATELNLTRNRLFSAMPADDNSQGQVITLRIQPRRPILKGTLGYSCISVDTSGLNTHAPHLPVQWMVRRRCSTTEARALQSWAKWAQPLPARAPAFRGGVPRLIRFAFTPDRSTRRSTPDNNRYRSEREDRACSRLTLRVSPAPMAPAAACGNYNLHIIHPPRNAHPWNTGTVGRS